MNELDGFNTLHPTATRPLLGMTILAVEDSRYACDAMRLLCLRSGARIRRADCLRSARRHLQVYQPTAVIIDLGLPDGNGAELINELAHSTPRVAAILGTSGDDFAEDVAISAGADGFLSKPMTSVSVFQTAILSALPQNKRPDVTRLVCTDPIHPDPIAYRDDMEHASMMLEGTPDPSTLGYVVQFLSGVARSAEDTVLADAVGKLASASGNHKPFGSQLARVSGLVHLRLEDQLAL